MDVLGVFPHTHAHTQASRWTHEERHLPWDQDQYRNEVVTLPSLSPRPHSSCGVDLEEQQQQHQLLLLQLVLELTEVVQELGDARPDTLRNYNNNNNNNNINCDK
ncbi:hypothetical protein Pcinc_025409 [Petrolisthes cinctipes]|uniref:Uncharacterized protein n=1 Tax=Petrolisthes cinctipes TaxID=88211 RepID=A0AAE1F9D6_PETCI|nr:hypothetical protein Pcinc_025409 [Petrolisthes cinctipes]